MTFADFDSDRFLADYWQKKPLLIRGAWTDWANPLEPDDLAALACDEALESRLIVHKRKGLVVEHGPFAEKRFAKLGKKPWTLLVQAVDHHVAEVAELIEPFRFVPNWRIDDVMVSYASDGGGVGPHFDHYDVFLVQGLGRRFWQIGAACDEATELLPHDDLRLLAHFEPVDEWVLDPGDMLYVPPGIAHNGVAVGDDCMTYSIGFRAPARSELIAHFCDSVLSELTEDDRYADPDLRAQANPGEIAPEALARLHAMVIEKLADKAAFARWFGAYSSTPKHADRDGRAKEPVSAKSVQAMLTGGATLHRNPASRFTFVRDGEGLTLFVDGEAFACEDDAIDFAERLCGHESSKIDTALAGSAPVVALCTELLNHGSITRAPNP